MLNFHSDVHHEPLQQVFVIQDLLWDRCSSLSRSEVSKVVKAIVIVSYLIVLFSKVSKTLFIELFNFVFGLLKQFEVLLDLLILLQWIRVKLFKPV